jgi:outer membrane protein TolC
MQDERRHLLHELHAEQVDALSMLAERIGLETRHGLQLPVDFELPGLPKREVAAWQQRALASRADLLASAAAVDAAQAERALDAGSWRKTEPDIGARIERDPDGMAMIGPELRVALPIFDDGRARADRADARVREARHREVGQRREVLLAVERALDLLFAAADQVAGTAEHLARTQAADALAERQHRNGSIGLIERIDAQRDVLVAERQQLDARLVLAQAHVELQRAVGGSGG